MRVKEFKEKANKVKSMMGSPDYETVSEELRKDEKKLIVSIFWNKLIFFKEHNKKTRKGIVCSISFVVKSSWRFINWKKNEK